MNTFYELLIQELVLEAETLQEVENATKEEILTTIDQDTRIQEIKNKDINIYNELITKIMETI